MKNPGVRYGFLGGLAVVFFFAILYFSHKELIIKIWPHAVRFLIYLPFMYVAAKIDCAQHGLNRDFREITRTPFVVFLLINLAYWLLIYTLHLADAELSQMKTAAEIQYYNDQLASGTGDPEYGRRLREQIAYLEKEGMALTLGEVFKWMCAGAVGGFILSAGIAAILRSKK